MRNSFIFFLLSAVIALNLTQVYSKEESRTPEKELEDKLYEEIMWISEEMFLQEVTSVSKKTERVAEAAAAIYVISQEDIRHSGVNSIPELLRMVPGLQVAGINANSWAVSSRGFNGRFANKLLVLIDGRSVYTLLFSGVYWDVQNVMLEDVERIEVIRGPGSTLWGANAVNGVINIITKNSEDTQGGLLTGGGGDKAERVVGGFRYGGKISKDAYYRLYTRYLDHDNFNISINSPGSNANDNWQISQGGFRIDWDLSPVDTLTLKGDIYDGDVNELARISLRRRDKDVSGLNVLGRWKHIFSDTSDMSFQVYYDQAYRKEDVFFREIRDTFDLDFHHRFRLSRQHELIWGLGYRYTTDDFKSCSTTTLDPDREGINLFSAFVQDEISLIDDQLQLMLGTKIEHNDFTGLELQPNVRALWSPTQRQKVWAVISRAVRTPNRSENDILTKTSRSIVLGNGDYDSEDILAFELGYRVQMSKSFSVDIATFFNIYDNLLTVETGIDPFSGLSTFIVDNKMDGETFGLEISTQWNVTDSWKLTAGYTYLQMQLHLDDTSTGIGQDVLVESASPQNQGSLRSNLDLPYNLEFDTSLNYVDHLGTGDISSYLRLDARLGWQPAKSIDVSIGIRNLLDDDHAEFSGASGGLIKTEIERSIFGKIEWRF